MLGAQLEEVQRRSASGPGINIHHVYSGRGWSAESDSTPSHVTMHGKSPSSRTEKEAVMGAARREKYGSEAFYEEKEEEGVNDAARNDKFMEDMATRARRSS